MKQAAYGAAFGVLLLCLWAWGSAIVRHQTNIERAKDQPAAPAEADPSAERAEKRARLKTELETFHASLIEPQVPLWERPTTNRANVLGLVFYEGHTYICYGQTIIHSESCPCKTPKPQ